MVMTSTYSEFCLTWQEDRHTITAFLRADKPHAQASAVFDDPHLRGWDKLEKMTEAGGRLEDPVDTLTGKSVAAWQEHFIDTGALAFRLHYKDGKHHDPAPGVAAYVEYHKSTGLEKSRRHFIEGFLQDPAPGVPAHLVFDEATGMETQRFHHQNQMLEDPSPGIPAMQKRDPATGGLKEAYSFRKDKRVYTFSREELEALDEKLAAYMARPRPVPGEVSSPLPRQQAPVAAQPETTSRPAITTLFNGKVVDYYNATPVQGQDAASAAPKKKPGYWD